MGRICWTTLVLLYQITVVQCGLRDKVHCPVGENAHVADVTSGSKDQPSIFDELTHDEIEKVKAFMYQQDDLEVKREAQANMRNTYIYLMEAMPPAKGEVLEYLDNRGSKPERFAKVILHRGDISPPAVEEYKVGPLPNPTTIRRILYTKWKNPIPYSTRSTIPDNDEYDVYIRHVMDSLDPLMEDVVGYTYNNCGKRCLAWIPGTPGDFSIGSHKIVVTWLRKLEGEFVHPVGLQMRIDFKSLNSTQWNVDLAWFRGSLYDSVEELLAEWSPGSTIRQEEAKKKVIYENNEELYSSLNFRGEPRPTKPLRGPTSYYPDGRRYEVEGHHVNWLGWSFDFTVPSVLGLTLYDIKFLKERIAYELSPQEISVRYSGKSPWGQYTAYHDTFVQMGRETYEMFPGVDCPKYAQFFNFTHFLHGEPFLFKNSACLFELDRGIPLRRHYQSDQKGGYDFYHGMPDNVLVMRSMITAWNYDYILDYIFHQQGGIEVVASLSGYILSTYHLGPEHDPYGYKTFADGLGNIHHHLLHFKVDLDIQGTSNRFQTLNISIEPDEDVAGDEEPNYLYKFSKNLRETEKDAACKFNFDTPKYMLFYNEEAKNKHGNPKSYRLLPVHQSKWLTPENWKMEKSFSWARYQVAVTKQKMDEYVSSNIYSTMGESDPVLTFQDYIDDDENIVDEDLVAWVTLGTIHIPRSEDIPIVLTQGVQLTFHLLPFNYFDEDVSLASRDNIRVTPGKDGGMVYKYSGVDEDLSCVPRDVTLLGGVGMAKGMPGLMLGCVFLVVTCTF